MFYTCAYAESDTEILYARRVACNCKSGLPLPWMDIHKYIHAFVGPGGHIVHILYIHGYVIGLSVFIL